jgi:hypothetical protein
MGALVYLIFGKVFKNLEEHFHVKVLGEFRVMFLPELIDSFLYLLLYLLSPCQIEQLRNLHPPAESLHLEVVSV